ncbi:hypothetical protein CYY_002934 [Polysphondylium violaceum]|uniref:Signal peptidase complex subunit 2 n=1 Tax=Polysphondylium violaceum TaxID=133409 RepID=A0A8J4V6E3_9MYCE|nr:hypothetical protein CYY_002934 [Polysphondylium violaceum]
MSDENEKKEKPVQVTLYDSLSMKQTLDDAVVKYITDKLGYKQNHKMNYIKVLLGFIGCCLAALAQFYPVPFPQNKPILIVCVFFYAIISTILYYINMFIQKDYIVFAVKESNEKEIQVSSTLPRYDPNYTIKIEYRNISTPTPITFTKSIDQYFDIKGYFVQDKFFNDLSGVFKKFITTNKAE